MYSLILAPIYIMNISSNVIVHKSFIYVEIAYIIELFYGCHQFICNEGWFWDIHVDLSLPMKDEIFTLFQKI